MPLPPISARPASPDVERRRARLVVLLALLGICASLLAYGLSPTVRHAVVHAAHSVSHALDKDKKEHKAPVSSTPARPAQPAGTRTGPGG